MDWSERTRAFAAMTLLTCAAASCSTPHKPVQALVNGRVFLITRGGDLKPARLADLYLLNSDLYRDDSIEKAEQSASRSCQSLWRDARFIREWPATLREFSFAQGQADLRAYQKVVLDKLPTDHSQAFITQADEDGRFVFRDVPPGSYVITAFGQAGVNLAAWRDSVSVKPNQPLELKLSSVVVTCPVG